MLLSQLVGADFSMNHCRRPGRTKSYWWYKQFSRIPFIWSRNSLLIRGGDMFDSIDLSCALCCGRITGKHFDRYCINFLVYDPFIQAMMWSTAVQYDEFIPSSLGWRPSGTSRSVSDSHVRAARYLSLVNTTHLAEFLL